MVRQVCAVFDEDTYNRIVKDAEDKEITKSKAISKIVSDHYTNDNSMGTNEILLKKELELKEQRIKDMEKDIGINEKLIESNEIILKEHLKLREERIQDLEKSLAWLRDAYSFLAVRALPEPKPARGFWARLFKRNKDKDAKVDTITG